MSDEVDNANALAEFYLKTALSVRTKVLEIKWKCYYCDSPTEKLFCDTGCREDYETAQLAKKRAGK